MTVWAVTYGVNKSTKSVLSTINLSADTKFNETTTGKQ